MIAYDVQVIGAQQVIGAFTGIERLVDDLQSVLEPIGLEALSDIRHGFDVAGPGWEPHAESTRKRKIGPSRILWDTGALRDSFTKGTAGNIFRLNPREMEVGSNIHYGIYHQEGRGHNPVRLIVNATEQDEAKYTRIAMDELIEKIRALGFEVT